MTGFSLENFCYVTQIIAVIAVVISLFYVGLPLKQNTHTLRLNAQRESSTEYIRIQQLLAQDSELMEIVMRSETKPESLNDLERRRAWAVADSLLELCASEFYRYQEGALPDYSWEPIALDMKKIMNMPIYQELWQARKHAYSEQFQNFIDPLTGGGTAS